MGPPLAPVMTNFSMKYSEEIALRTVQHELTHWFRYADDKFVSWSHGEDKLHKVFANP
jgi:hypothetical protein